MISSCPPHLLASVAESLVRHLHVYGPGVLQLEGLPAALLGADEGPLARVHALVVVDVVLEAEGTLAEAALEVARPGAGPRVLLHCLVVLRESVAVL